MACASDAANGDFLLASQCLTATPLISICVVGPSSKPARTRTKGELDLG